MAIMETLIEIPAALEANVFGKLDEHLKKIERALNVTMVARDGTLKLIGEAADVKQAESVLMQLLELARRGNTVTEQNVNYALGMILEHRTPDLVSIDSDIICHTIQGKPVKPKTAGQKAYIDLIRKKMIVFGIGPAGTGKTYLAMAMAIEAGEKLGFLPGDLQSKVDPYLRPLYDALHQIMGADSYLRNVEKGLIEVAPLAYMRGRTLDNSYIILDEAQNTTPAQMKMFLTRIGFGSKVIITGDLTQKDLPSGTTSGLDQALDVLGKVEDIGIAHMTNQDVVRHPLVQQIVKAYDDYDKRMEKQRKRNQFKENRGAEHRKTGHR